MNPVLRKRLSDRLESRQDAGLERAVKVFDPDREVLNLSNNDYLNLANNIRIANAAKEAIDRFGCSASASPLITGFGHAHEVLLNTLKEWYQFESGMIWNSGYVANQAILKSIARKGDLVIADRLIHNSMVTGILGSGARLVRYRHCDLSHLESLLEKFGRSDRMVFVVTESVFSMDGDYPDLAAIGQLKEKYGFFWIVDEAHAIGWYGKKGSGLVEDYGVGDNVDALIGTFGKALGSMGAFSLFHDETLAAYLANFADEFIYSTFLAPASAAAAKEAIDCVVESNSIRTRGHELSVEIRERLIELGYETMPSDSPIISIPFGDPQGAVDAADSFEKQKIRVSSIRPPTVPEGTSRLRLSLKGDLSREDVDRIVGAFQSLATESQ